MVVNGSISVREALTIAVVDDEAAIRALIRRGLEREFVEQGINVLEGRTGEDAVALRFGIPTPGLLIVNWMMPGMDGVEAIAAIRHREQAENLPRVPIIFESSSVPEAPVPGADASLKCPFFWRELIDTVDHLVAPALGPRLTNRA